MREAVFTVADVASWRADSAFAVSAASAFDAGRISIEELRLCTDYAAGGPSPPSDVTSRVIG